MEVGHGLLLLVQVGGLSSGPPEFQIRQLSGALGAGGGQVGGGLSCFVTNYLATRGLSIHLPLF